MARIQSSSPEASRRMAKVRQKSTGAEVAVRRELYRRGLRYRVDFEVLKKPRRVADIAFPSRRIAVFVDGCFWHGCPEHATWPKQNAEFWRQKIEANRLRDADTNSRLFDYGWTVLRPHHGRTYNACRRGQGAGSLFRSVFIPNLHRLQKLRQQINAG